MVLEAPKLYLDTSHLIRIAKLRRDKGALRTEVRGAYELLDKYIREHHFGLIFSPISALEWVDGNATLGSALEIATVIDSAPLQYEIEADTFVYLHEVLNQLRLVDSRLILPHFDILFVRDPSKKAERALAVLKDATPSFFDPVELDHEKAKLLPNEIPFLTAKDEVKIAWDFKQKNPGVYQERVDGYKFATSRERASYLTAKRGKQDILGWMKGFLKIDRIISALNPSVDVETVLSKVDISKCPAIHLNLASVNQRVKAGNEPKDNDVDDWMSVAVFPYADVVLTERQLRHFVCHADASFEAKVTHDPIHAVTLLKDWLP